MIKFVQVTYPFLLMWVAFTHRKIANLEESLSQVKETTENNEHLSTNVRLDFDKSIQETDIVKDEGSKMLKDINHYLNADADSDKEVTTSFEGSVVNNGKKNKYDQAKEKFNFVTYRPRKSDNVNLHAYDEQERRLFRNDVREQIRKRNVYSADFNTKRSVLIHERKLSSANIKSYNTTTTCVLLNDLDSINSSQYESNNSITTFNFILDLMTDGYPEETSWKFLPQNSNITIIDSRNENITSSDIVNNTFHEFEYHCVVSSEETYEIHEILLENICYNFELHDKFGDGICCDYGLGYFILSLNNSTAPLIVDRLYTSLLTSPFCLGNSNTSSENKVDTSSKYPAQECMNESCICNSKPRLSNIKEDDDLMFDTKFFVLNGIMMISDSKALTDYESPQYKAACWVLYDDPFFHKNSFEIEKRQQRMIQRYLLSLLYFTMGPEKWENHYHFLSSKSECEWNDGHKGIICDEDSNAFFIDLGESNLEGTIVGELSELRTLEELHLYGKIHGAIPSVLGRLSELRVLNLYGNDLEGTIPETIGNLQKLNYLSLGENYLSGSIPEALYLLKNLKVLRLDDNKLSSSISSHIGNFNKLELLKLSNNILTGQIPSTIGSLSLLEWLDLDNNKLNGPIPESLFDLPYLDTLFLQDNSVTGSVPNEFCERSDDIDYFFVEADCRNDVFDPEVSCSCCTCKDESPIWHDNCKDTTVKLVIDHIGGNSHNLEWSLTNDATGKKILFDGPYSFLENGLESYEACVAYSDCFSFNQIYPPYRNTNYTIYWNNNSIHHGRFLGWKDNDDVNKYDPPQPLLSFSYNQENKRLASCDEVEFICDEEKQSLTLKPNTTKRIIYDQAVKISGKSTIQDTYSPQSKALCWILNNNSYVSKTELVETEIIQRYVLATLHFMSSHRLFGGDEYLAGKHECDWNGITCEDNNTNIVTGISLSNQVINGTIIEELGSLKYLKALDLSQTQLYGSIPQTFSNLWSLKELNLSGNEIGGTMPETLFHQLNKLEHIDLSHNILSGSINKDIGSYSNIRTLLLRDNLLTGSIPLEGFNYYDLEHIDICENKLSVLDFALLLVHKKLNIFDIASNFFVGSLHADTFTSLTELQYINISQNDISGTIPSTYPKLSNITHFDVHVNRLKGPIPLGIKELQSIQHLNLQGNKLTGSLPSELNQLKSLNTLALSHNELKGSIPFDQTNLQNIKRLHLQNNKLEGEAPQFSNMISYITDCGFPSDSLDKVSCSSCSACCNSDGGCQSKSSEELGQKYLTLIFMLTIVGFIIVCYALKDRITSNKYLESFFEEKVKSWNALMLISDKSVYHFLLIDNKTQWYVAVVCGIFQTATLLLFLYSADMVNETSDREYLMLCPANSLECEDLKKVSSYGIFVFGLILTIWLLRDIIGSVKLMLVSFEKRNIDFFFTSGVVFSVTMLSLWTSILYVDAIAAKNTDMIKDAVVLLFVDEIDERIFQLVECVNPEWTNAIERNMRNSLVYEGKNLIISSWLKKCSESFSSLNKMICQRNVEPPQVNSEDEDKVVRRDESNP